MKVKIKTDLPDIFEEMVAKLRAEGKLNPVPTGSNFTVTEHLF